MGCLEWDDTTYHAQLAINLVCRNCRVAVDFCHTLMLIGFAVRRKIGWKKMGKYFEFDIV